MRNTIKEFKYLVNDGHNMCFKKLLRRKKKNIANRHLENSQHTLVNRKNILIPFPKKLNYRVSTNKIDGLEAL